MAGENLSYTIVFNTVDNNYSVGPGHSGEHFQTFATKQEACDFVLAGLPDPVIPLNPPIEGGTPEPGSVTEQILKDKEAKAKDEQEEDKKDSKKEEEEEEEKGRHSKGKKK